MAGSTWCPSWNWPTGRPCRAGSTGSGWSGRSARIGSPRLSPARWTRSPCWATTGSPRCPSLTGSSLAFFTWIRICRRPSLCIWPRNLCCFASPTRRLWLCPSGPFPTLLSAFGPGTYRPWIWTWQYLWCYCLFFVFPSFRHRWFPYRKLERVRSHNHHACHSRSTCSIDFWQSTCC